MNKNLVFLKSPLTGLFYKFGEGFTANGRNNATPLTADDVRAVKLVYTGDMEEIEATEWVQPKGKKSLAQRIHEGELDQYSAAIAHVIECNHKGQRSFTIRDSRGEYFSRVVKYDKTGPSRVAWINFCGHQLPVIWSRGELALEWAS